MSSLQPIAVSWQAIAECALAGARGGAEPITRAQAEAVLGAGPDELLPLLHAAFRVRREFHGRRVHIHVLENAKLGACPEDCGFCSQSSRFGSPGGQAPMKTVDELVEGARRAAASGAYRYCMVTATRGPSSRDLDTICEAARRIKSELRVELCASLGLLTEAKAQRLAEAGIDRFNHNLETSERHFGSVVSTHRYADRVETLRLARQAGMETCSGGIVGLGESETDVLDLAFALRALDVDSVPVNFLDPRPGTPLGRRVRIEPTYALKVLCMFRFVHPRADLRVAGGREVTLRSVQPLALYPANSIFTSGYLTTGGNLPDQDHQMIRDMGFEIEVVGAHAPEETSDHGSHQPCVHEGR
jgi:biotin synthase